MGPVFWDFMHADQKLGGSKNVGFFGGEKTTKKSNWIAWFCCGDERVPVGFRECFFFFGG